MKPYTYYLYHIPTRLKYYGSQYGKGSDPIELWVTYFTSSKKVKALISQYGKDSFIVKIRKIFDTRESALRWEATFLSKIDARNRADWLNQHNGDGKFYCKGHTDDTKKKLRRINLGKTMSEDTKKKISIKGLGKKLPFRVRGKRSDTTKEKIRKANIGQIRSNAAKMNMSVAAKNRKPLQKVIDNKEYFLTLPANSKRPIQGKSKLANILNSYMNKAHGLYDLEFHSKMKENQPHWFRD